MRDNREGFPEIVNAYERDGQYFGAVRLDRSGNTATFEFGVAVAGYTALKRILRPPDLQFVLSRVVPVKSSNSKGRTHYSRISSGLRD